MGLEALLGPVAVVVEQLVPGGHVLSGHQDESREAGQGHDLGLQVGVEAGVVDQSTQAAGL